MIDFEIAEQAERTWLYNLIQAAEAMDIKYLHQGCETEFVNGGKASFDTPFLLLAPAGTVDEFQDGIETIVLTFDIIAVSAQKPGDSLKANQAIHMLLSVIEKALYSPERVTMNAMEKKEYSLPMQSFDDQGSPTQTNGQIEYRRSIWTDSSGPADSVRQWNTTITAYVTT